MNHWNLCWNDHIQWKHIQCILWMWHWKLTAAPHFKCRSKQEKTWTKRIALIVRSRADSGFQKGSWWKNCQVLQQHKNFTTHSAFQIYWTNGIFVKNDEVAIDEDSTHNTHSIIHNTNWLALDAKEFLNYCIYSFYHLIHTRLERIFRVWLCQ